MINYLKSENYRLLHKKNLYMTSVICLLLIAAAAVVLYYSQKSDPSFPYATTRFFYSNVIGSGGLIMIISFLFNFNLTGKDTSLIKQSVSFGISRNTIFWSKLILTLSYFLLVCVIGLFLMIMLGENLLSSEDQSINNFLIASINMVPIILSGFFIIHALKMLKISDVYIFILLLLIVVFSGDLLRFLLRPFAGLNELYKYAPNTLLNENLMNFFNGVAKFGFEYWITGIGISVVALLIGSRKFARLNID